MPASRSNRPVNQPTWRRPRDTIVPETGHDAYRDVRQAREPAECRVCGAVLHRGRWTWSAPSGSEVPVAVTCPACRRIADDFPAGILSITGPFVSTHRDDILGIIRAEERLETAEHPLHRIISLFDEADGITITTTDVHLPRRIAEALRRAYEGDLEIAYGHEDETVRISWRRDDAREPEGAEPPASFPVDIRANGVIVTPEANAYLHERINRLRRFYPAFIGCRVVIEAPERHHRKGGPYRVAIHAEIPGVDLHVTRTEADDLHVAIRTAFQALQRQLDERVARMKPDGSRPIVPPRGTVVRLFRDEGYGFIAAADGHEVYFHRNAVLPPGFDDLRTGDEVRYHEEPGIDGPQASTVEATHH
jgi:ribosomal subunit interface protein